MTTLNAIASDLNLAAARFQESLHFTLLRAEEEIARQLDEETLDWETEGKLLRAVAEIGRLYKVIDNGTQLSAADLAFLAAL